MLDLAQCHMVDKAPQGLNGMQTESGNANMSEHCLSAAFMCFMAKWCCNSLQVLISAIDQSPTEPKTIVHDDK